jgi:hypothetical protein
LLGIVRGVKKFELTSCEGDFGDKPENESLVFSDDERRGMVRWAVFTSSLRCT